MQYLIEECDEQNNNENEEPIPNAIRYPGDIKIKSVPIDILKHALQEKEKKIQQLKTENRKLKKEKDTFERKLEMVHKVLDSLVNKKYLGSEMVKMIKVFLKRPSLSTILSEGRISIASSFKK